jgi:hypothetical protein
MTAQPAFISWIGHGAASLAPPAAFTGVKAHLFTFNASKTTMQKLVDALLNSASDGTVHYEALLDTSFVTFMDIARCTSKTDAIGWVPGRECALWVPLLETTTGHLFPRVVFWTPYIFIDYTIGMLTGREVWGWAKVGARIGVPGDAPGAPAAFTCTTTVFDTFSPQTQGIAKPLLTVTGTAPLAAPATTWTDGGEAGHYLLSNLLGSVASELLDALGLKPVLPAVAMKQFRASDDPAAACFQGIVDSPARITQFTGGGLLAAADFTLTIATCASHPIVADLLGMPATPGATKVPIAFAAWLSFDFEALPGRTLVSAT